MTRTCRRCASKEMLIDHGSADIVCTDCGCVWGKWSPEYAEDLDLERSVYERSNYFETVVDNFLGYNAPVFDAKLLDKIVANAAAIPRSTFTIETVRCATRKMKLKGIAKTAGLIAHAIRFGDRTPYPRLHHVERECMGAYFDYVTSTFEGYTDKGKRKNLISYNYILARLLEVVGRYDDFAHLLIPIKTKSKLTYAAKVWKYVESRAPWTIAQKNNRSMACVDYVRGETFHVPRPKVDVSKSKKKRKRDVPTVPPSPARHKRAWVPGKYANRRPRASP